MASINASTSGGGGVIVTSDASGDLNIQSGGSTVVAVTSAGVAVTGTLSASNGISVANTFGFKNRIINGGMVIDQRNAGASVTPTSGTYTLDRWLFYVSQASKLTAQQNAGSVTPPAGFSKYLGITSSAATSVGASDYFFSTQRIEGFNTADLAWGTANAATVTLSFRVYSSLTGTFGGALQNANQTRSYPFTYSVPVANTWTTISVTVTGDTSGTWVGATNGVGLVVCFGLGMGSTYSGTAGAWAGAEYYSATGAVSVVGTSGATFYITGVQLEKGSTATSFDFRAYSTELAMCQRYYQTSAINVPDTNCGFFGVVYGGGSTQAYGNASFKTLMRATATVTLYDGGTAGNVAQTGIGGSAATAGNINAYGFSVVNKTSGNFNTTAGYIIISGFTASAEL
jgi:hypothetical protein